MKRATLPARAAGMLESIGYGDSWRAGAARRLLTPLSCIMAAATDVRSRLYERGVVRVVHVDVPVISVGNLRVGGTGKTPTVLWLAARLKELGRSPLVALRGYGSSAARLVLDFEGRVPVAAARLVAESGFGLLRCVPTTAPMTISDEAVLVALRASIPVAIAAKRSDSARLARVIGCDCVVLDDGFQHRALHRDLDIVLTCSEDETAQVLPAGPLREPWRALARADVVLSTDVSRIATTALRARLRQGPVGLVRHVAAEAAVSPISCIRDREVIAVAGIARPGRFFEMLRESGAVVRKKFEFPDHHPYTAADWRCIRDTARRAEWIVTTEKDLVKLGPIAVDHADLRALRVEAVIEPPDEVLRAVLAMLRPLDASRIGPHDH